MVEVVFIVVLIKMIIMVIMIIIIMIIMMMAVEGTILDFLQSSLCARRCLQHSS